MTQLSELISGCELSSRTFERILYVIRIAIMWSLKSDKKPSPCGEKTIMIDKEHTT